jgi:hypothetical protein
MKAFGLATLLCAVALMGAPGAAGAFETESTNSDMIDGQTLLAPQSLATGLNAHSLAMPLSGKSDSSSAFVGSYGNSIPIPAPGIDLPAPAWAASVGAISLH